MKPNRKKRLEELLTRLELPLLQELTLVHQALTHPSYLSESTGVCGEHNQRLEFLGDAVVGLVIGEYLYQTYPEKTEGQLTRMRAAVVCEASLAQGARQLQLGDYLLLGRGEEQMGGAQRSSNLADCFEAFMGAVYLTSGLETVQPLILNVLKAEIMRAGVGKFGDYKTQLQEFVQRQPDQFLSYRIIREEGPDHLKKFYAAVFLNEKELAAGSGATKKEAEQHAAQKALHNLGVE